MSLVLSLFPGIGLLDMAFEEEGFCVVRGPDLLWGGDIKRFHPPAGVFDGVIGGPPCQAHSRLANLVRHVHGPEKVAEDLIPEFVRCVEEAQPRWWLSENVPEAPVPQPHGYEAQSVLWNNRWVGGEQNRMRRFAYAGSGRLDLTPDAVALEAFGSVQAVCASGGGRAVPVRLGGSGKPKRSRLPGAGDDKTRKGFERALAAQGLPDDFDLPPFTVAAKVRAIGNGVPLPLGRAVARAVKRAIA